MTDIKKILIASICVVLAVAIAAGVSIGVLAGTVNGLKDTVAELQQANEAQEALNASMKAELDAAKANGENIVTAEEFETKLAAALGEQNQTMQALISTAVKNQIEELETEGLTEAQVQEIINAAVANCLTEADIDAIVAGVDSGLTKDEVKKIVADYTVGTLTYGQIIDLIDDADYDLRVYLEKQIKAVADAVEELGGDIKDLDDKLENGLGDIQDVVSGKTKVVSTLADFQAALDEATSDVLIQLGADITGDVKITQKDGVNIVIDGNDYKFTGVMTVFGDARQKEAETLTIKNINFVAANGASSCIYSPDRTEQTPARYSYSHNVTVENCTFTDPDGDVNCAAIRHGDGGDKNWVVKNCAVDGTMHSLIQVNNVEGKLIVENCVVESKNGLNLNSCTNVEIIGCEFDTVGYAIRFGVNSGGNLGTPKSYVIKDSTLKSACDDGDAVIIFRKSAVDAVMTLENTTLVGTTEISGNTDVTTITKK